MRVVEITEPGGPEVLRLSQRPVPEINPTEVLVRVVAAGVNRPDVQQRRGLYPPPPGASDIPGLDIAGVVEAAGSACEWPKLGDRVCALVNGGGYAQFCAVPAVQCMPIPRGLSQVEAASLPEVYFTAWNNMIWLGRLAMGERLLVQGGTSGVGMAAIQIAKTLRRATVYATAGTDEKRKVCQQIGADHVVDYHDPNWTHEILDRSSGSGLDVIMDGQAGDYAQKQLDLLAPDGRLVFIASHRGEWSNVNIRNLVRRRLTITGSTLRPRHSEYKGRIARELVAYIWPLLEEGRIMSRIHATMPLDMVQDAHDILDRNEQIGKVVLIVDPAAAND